MDFSQFDSDNFKQINIKNEDPGHRRTGYSSTTWRLLSIRKRLYKNNAFKFRRFRAIVNIMKFRQINMDDKC